MLADQSERRGEETSGTRPVVVVFSMALSGHFASLRAPIADLVDDGFDVVVLSDERFADAAASLGARFVDLFGPFPLEPVDVDATPRPVRYVSYAARYAEELVELVRELDPVLIVYETYAVIGNVVARLLDVPYVSVSVLHDLPPEVAEPYYRDDPRLKPTDETAEAIARLAALGLDDVGLFSFATLLSPHLNLYPEPPEFLPSERRASFEPVAFYGSILRRPVSPGRWFADDGRTKVYVSFGSYLSLALPDRFNEAMTCVVEGLATDDGIDALVSLGSPDADEATAASLTRPNVRVERWVDQPAVLAQADVYVTHHGLGSTHDAIDQRVPMLSFPFFADQPAQAARCQELGIALPLCAAGELPSPEHVRASVALAVARRDELLERLEVVREWEDAVIAQRPAVVAQLRVLATTRR